MAHTAIFLREHNLHESDSIHIVYDESIFEYIERCYPLGGNFGGETGEQLIRTEGETQEQFQARAEAYAFTLV